MKMDSIIYNTMGERELGWIVCRSLDFEIKPNNNSKETGRASENKRSEETYVYMYVESP